MRVLLMAAAAAMVTCGSQPKRIKPPPKREAGEPAMCVKLVRANGDTRWICAPTAEGCEGDRWTAERYGNRAGIVGVSPCVPVVLLRTEPA